MMKILGNLITNTTSLSSSVFPKYLDGTFTAVFVKKQKLYI